MKIYFAILATLFLVPPVFALGYISNGNDIPSFGDYLLTQENVKHVPGFDDDQWFIQATSGPHKGGVMELVYGLSKYRTHKDIEKATEGKVRYIERKCEYYTTTGKKNVQNADETFIHTCHQETKTRKQAEDYMLVALAPEPKS